MKIYTCIASMILAVVMLLVAPYIPHHHHDGAVCIVAEHCHEDNCGEKRHTDHGGDDSTCIENEQYLTAKSGSWQDSLIPHFFPILVAIVNQLVSGRLHIAGLPADGYFYAAYYHSASVAAGRAMRAPPYFFS